MPKPLILVTAAAGKTGSPVVRQMLERGFPVRALVRRHDERSKHLEKLGAEVVLGDFLAMASMRNAMQGVGRAYFCYPPQVGGLVEATAITAAAARDAGVVAVVNMSQISARERSASPLARQHWVSELVLDWAGIGAVHVRPTFFAEMLIILGRKGIASSGKLYLPYGAERHAPVAADDIARVIVGILTDPTPHVGERHVVTGPRNMTIAEMAEVLTRELGRPVEYVDLPVADWGRVLVDQGDLPEFLVTHLKGVAQDHQNGVFSAQTDVVERIGGHAPQTLEEFVRRNSALFENEGVESHE
jgi:uncharacterized protein YbjT (DUF2867 family)